MTPYDSMYGLKVVTDEEMVDTVWVFPKDRFVEYEPKDEWWCRKYGLGHEEVRPKQEVVRAGDTLYMHPAVWKQMGEQTLFLEKAAGRVLKKMSDDLMKTTCEPPAAGFITNYVEGSFSCADILVQALALKDEWRREQVFNMDRLPAPLPAVMPPPAAPYRDLFRFPVDPSPFLLTTV